jgi:hypothetical protein
MEDTMVDPSQIRVHTHVHCSDGEHLGTVDSVDGDQIKLTKRDPTAHGRHHTIPLEWVASIEGTTLRLGKTGAEARAHWKTGSTSF